MFNNRAKLAALLGLSFVCSLSAYAANPVDLSHQDASVLQSYMSSPAARSATSSISLKEINRATDVNQTLHVRVQETYAGYPVWGGDAVVHVKKANKANLSLASLVASPAKAQTTMNGVVYQGLTEDLKSAPSFVFSQAQADKALQYAVSTYQQQAGFKSGVDAKQSQLMVFVDDKNKAHWAFLVSMKTEATSANSMPAKPVFILDAETFQIYQQWDNIQTIEAADATVGGGFGGNTKMGKLVYDGLQGNLPAISMQRDATKKICFLQNADVTVKDVRRRNAEAAQFPCEKEDADHGGIFWDADFDAINGSFSPANDALYAGKVVKEMYQDWYEVPVLTKNGKPMMLMMNVHLSMENAYWDGQSMSFGDGGSMFYPLTSLGVAAHEVSHGFTEQHSGLQYYGQSGGLNESFSDMAAQAAEFYSYGTNSWQIGPEIFKAENQALRYMDKPSKDCGTKKPGNWCSIDEVSQYKNGIDVHHSSGIFNRVFYLLGTSEGWDTRKAFDVMVQANQFYWTSTSNFIQSACGVLKATADKGYDDAAVKTALTTVGIDISSCA